MCSVLVLFVTDLGIYIHTLVHTHTHIILESQSHITYTSITLVLELRLEFVSFNLLAHFNLH